MKRQAITEDHISSYLRYLPAIFQQESENLSRKPFIGRFLLAFEQVLTGLGDGDGLEEDGLEEIIGRLHTYFEPGPAQLGRTPDPRERAPAEFLPWLASWVAFSLREDWTEEERRRYLAEIVSLYRLRGTKRNLEKLLQIYTGLVTEPASGCRIRVSDFAGQEEAFIVGRSRIGQSTQAGTSFIVGRSLVGLDSQIGGSPAHHFWVTIRMPDTYKPADVWRQWDIAANLIDIQKPAHTTYSLKILYATMRIDETLQIGVNTFLGTLR